MSQDIQAILKQGIIAHQANKLKEAEQAYRQVLRLIPTQPDANHNLGIIAISSKQLDTALSLFKTALNANLKEEQYWVSYVGALIAKKQYSTAIEMIKRGLAQGVRGDRLKSMLAKISNQEGRVEGSTDNPPQERVEKLVKAYQGGSYKEAEKSAIALTEAFPKYQFGWKVLGAIYKQLGKNTEAIAANKKAITLLPNDAEAHNNLGVVLKESGDYQAAEASYRKAIDLNPKYAQAYNNQGNVLKDAERLSEAVVAYKKAISIDNDYLEAHLNLGNAYDLLNDLSQSRVCYEKVISLNPNLPWPHHSLGVVLKRLGEFEKAKSCYTKAVSLEPTLAEAHRSLSALKTFTERDEQYQQMQSLISDDNTTDLQKCLLCFSLGKAEEDMGDFEQAFNFYQQGNALRKAILQYDIEQDETLFRQIKDSHSDIEKVALDGSDLKAAGSKAAVTPIFIVGMPRSGTTLVEQVVSAHPEIMGAGELDFVERTAIDIVTGSDIDESVLRDFRNDYLNKVAHIADGKTWVTDKMPQNFRYLGLIAAAIPEAKIIHVSRLPSAVCWSNYKHCFVSDDLGYCYDLEDIVAYYRLYEDLMDFWNSKLSDRIYHLDYEQLTLNQETETRKLIEFLGVSWDDDCLSPQDNERFVATASNMQVRKEVYQGSSQQWERYKPFIKGVFDQISLA